MLISANYDGPPYNPPTGNPMGSPPPIPGFGATGLIPVRRTPGCLNCVNGLRGSSSLGFGTIILTALAIGAIALTVQSMRK